MLHLPKFNFRLLSESQLDKNSFMITFFNGKVVIQVLNETTVAPGKLIVKLYKLGPNVDEFYKSSREIAIVATKNNNINLWHKCLRYLNYNALIQQLKQVIFCLPGLKLPI